MHISLLNRHRILPYYFLYLSHSPRTTRACFASTISSKAQFSNWTSSNWSSSDFNHPTTKYHSNDQSIDNPPYLYSTNSFQASAMSTSLREFIVHQKESYLKAVEGGTAGEWTIVMGNEAGDLDSIASSIAYSWYTAAVNNSPTVALSQTRRSELHLRAENLYALSQAGLDASDPELLCIDDIPTSSPFPSHRFGLVDHNRLNPRFSADNPDTTVVAVIDHHEDEGLYKDTADPRVIVVPTGSCATLVAGIFERASSTIDIPPELATLLLSSIIIDTAGLKSGGKAEDADYAAAAFLAPRSTLAPSLSNSLDSTIAIYSEPAVQTLNATLQEKKASVAHLTTLDLLRRDYKEYTMTPSGASSAPILVGLSTVPVGLDSRIPGDPKFWSSTEDWMAERGLSALGILTSFRDDTKIGKNGKAKHRREQMYVVRADMGELADQLFEGLEQSEELNLKKRKWKDFGLTDGAGFGTSMRAAVWKQKNVHASRKVTAPLVRAIIEGPNI